MSDENTVRWYNVKERTPPVGTLILYHAPGIFDPSNPAIWAGYYEADTRDRKSVV